MPNLSPPLEGGEDFAEKLDFRAKSGAGSKAISTNFTTPPRNLKISPLPQGEGYQKIIRDNSPPSRRGLGRGENQFFINTSS